MDENDLIDNELHRTHFATTYVVDCPEQHALPMSVLSGLLTDRHDRNGVEVWNFPLLPAVQVSANPQLWQEISRGPNIIKPRVEIRCPRCPGALIKRAVNVEPLMQLSEEFRQRKSKGLSGLPGHLLPLNDTSHMSQTLERATVLTPSQSPRLSDMTSDTDRRSAKSSENSSGHSKSNKKNTLWKQLTTWFRKSELSSVQTPDSYAFSADGRSVVLWTVGGAEVLGFDIPPMFGTQTSQQPTIKQMGCPIEGVRCACRGAAAVAIVSASSEQRQGNGRSSYTKARSSRLTGTSRSPLLT